MELNSISLSDFTRNALILFRAGVDAVPQVMRSSGLFKVQSIPQNSGDTREFSEIDLEEYAEIKGQGDQAARARVQQGYNKIARAYRIAKDIGITYEMRTQNKYPDVVAQLTNLGEMAAKRMDLDMSHRITFGTATTYTNKEGNTVDISIGDTRALFDTAHTLRGSTTTYRNILANNPLLSRSSLEGMEKLCVEQTLNQFGEKKSTTFDILFTTDDPNTVNMARELLRSTSSTVQSNPSVVNPYNGKYQHKILPRVATDANGFVDSTKATYWGLASSMMSSAYLGVLEEPHLKSPAAGNNGEEFSTDDWNFGVRAGYFVTVVGATWIKFSKGDGTA